VIDTHVHLDADAFEDAAAVWSEAQRAGVEAALAVGVDPDTWQHTIAVARALPDVSIALGIHPQAVPHHDDAALDRALAELPDLLTQTGAIAIGECGLDGPAGDLERQKRILRAHLAIARELSLPISLHVFRMHGPALELLREFGKLPASGVVHSYSGSAELVRDYLTRGLSFSFAGAVTRSNAKRPLDAARAIPLDHLVVETDAPFQPTGADARDRKRGDPADLPQVVEAIARARGIDPEELATRTTENARRIFRFT
jgi:TatD DNase family protein